MESTWKKSVAKMPLAWARRNCDQVGPKRRGAGTNVGTYGISISPSSISSAIATGISFTHAGGKVGVLNTSVPFGSVDFTSAALTAKSKKINAVYAGMGNNQNFALATALKQAGVKLKAVVFPTGHEADVIHTPAWRSLQGMYFGAQFRPTVLPNAGTRQLASALQKYQHRSPANFPTYCGRIVGGRRSHDQRAAAGREQSDPWLDG
jgi:branched-chain amino acid transport system substrate-binding protein